MNDLVARRLQDLPAEIQTAEEQLRAHALNLEVSERARQGREDAILLGRDHEGRVLNGKNAEQRAAEMRYYLEEDDLAIFQLKTNVEQAKIALHRKLNDFSAARALARLLGGVE